MSVQDLHRATLQLAEASARDLLAGFKLALVRIWLIQPPDGPAGVPVLAATAAAHGGASAGGMLPAHVLAALTSATPTALVLPSATGDARFEGTLPTGTFAGLPILGDRREPVGFVEAYATITVTLAELGRLEQRVNELAEVFASARATADAESPARGHILIADDDPSIRSLVKVLLERQGFAVTEVTNGVQAYVTSKRVKPDLVLIDWVMPVMDGRDAIVRLKSDRATRSIPVVMLTSQSQTEDKVSALEAGAQDFLVKPFDNRELVARIEQQMRWRKLLASDEPDDAPETAHAQTVDQTPAAPQPVPPPPVAAQPDVPIDPALLTGDVWTKAVEAQQLGRHREALALYMHEAERCEGQKQYPRAAIAYRSASITAGQVQNLDLSNKFLRLAGKMYLTWSETAQDSRAIQEGYVNAARCFLAAGNLRLAKKSVDFAQSFQAVLSDDRPSDLA
jgi:DNA-binding response OmpR family regulator